MKRTISFLLALILTLGLCPVSVRAAEEGVAAETQIQQTEAVAEPSETEETVSEPTVETAQATEETVPTEVATETEPLLYDIIVDGLDDSYSSPQSISNGQTKSGTVTNKDSITSAGLSMDKNDYFRFYLSRDAEVTIRVSGSYSLSVVLFDSDGWNIGSSSGTIRKFLSAGSYTVCVQNKTTKNLNYYSISLSYCAHTDYSTVTYPATCTQDGYIEYSCDSCGEIWTETIPSGHIIDSWEEIVSATCTSEGVKTAICRRCRETVREWIPKLSHAYGDWVITKKATCTEEGQKTKTCTSCDKQIQETILQTGHTPIGELELTEAPDFYAMETGYYSGTCSVCGSFKEKIPYNWDQKIPDGVTRIADRAFYNYRSRYSGSVALPDIVLPDTVTYIGEYAFAYSDVEVSLSDGLTSISDYAFQGWDGTSIEIPGSVTSIGAYAFADCEYLENVAISEGVTSIDAHAFEQCVRLQNIIIPEGVTSIDAHAFEQCVQLQNIIIPEGVMTIGAHAFESCEKLENITIPKTLVKIGADAFKDCARTRRVDITDMAAWCELEFETFYSNPLFTTYGLFFLNDVRVVNLEVPDGVTEISDFAFAMAYNLETVLLPDSVTRIGDGAFAGCMHLNQIEIPEGVTDIGIAAFYMCTLKQLNIPASVKSIGEYAFRNCTSLSHIFFSGDAPYWGTYSSEEPFQGVTATAYYPANNDTWTENVRNMGGYNANLTWVGCEHNFVGTSCSSKGLCRKCGATQWYSHEYSDATCTTPETCALCGATSGKALGHREVTYEGKAPTCTESGLSDKKECSVCKTVTQEQVVLDALGHKEVPIDGKDPTCTQSGLTEGKKCEVCKQITLEQEVMDPLGHNYVNTICTRCKESSVKRIAGSSRYLTAITAADTLKEILGLERFDSVVIASGTNFADALAGSYLAAVKQAPILLSTKNSDADNLKYIQENLAPGGTVYILGGTAAVSTSIENLLKNAGIIVKRLAGENRYLTNLEILKEAGFSGGEVLVAVGNNFADSLSASATGKPILLVGPKWDKISEDYVNYLSDKNCTFTIIGGEGAVKAAIEEDLKNYGEVRRIYGSTRMLTSVKVAENFFDAPKAAVLAYSGNFPDGLCGGPLAYALGAPLLLVNAGKEAAPAAYVAANGIQIGYIMGGESVVSDDSVKAVFGN